MTHIAGTIEPARMDKETEDQATEARKKWPTRITLVASTPFELDMKLGPFQKRPKPRVYVQNIVAAFRMHSSALRYVDYKRDSRTQYHLIDVDLYETADPLIKEDRERIKKEALGKLTRIERTALGI